MMDTIVIVDEDSSLFQLGDWFEPGLSYDEQLRRESDLRDARECDLHYQRRIERGDLLTYAEENEWIAAQAIVCAALAGEG